MTPDFPLFLLGSEHRERASGEPVRLGRLHQHSNMAVIISFLLQEGHKVSASETLRDDVISHIPENDRGQTLPRWLKKLSDKKQIVC